MPDHWQGLVSFPKQENMKKFMAGFGEATAKRAGTSWQRDFLDHRLRADGSYAAKAEYIRLNPVRKGFVTNSKDWPWIWTNAALPGLSGGRVLPAS